MILTKSSARHGCKSEEDHYTYYHRNIARIGTFMQGFIHSKLCNETNAMRTMYSTVVREHFHFRYNIIFVLINAVQNNRQIGIQVLSHRDGSVAHSRPFWIEVGYVTKNHIRNNLKELLRIDIGAKYLGRTGKKEKREDQNRTCDEEERVVLSGEIVIRLNQTVNGMLNRSRENSLSEFFKLFGFLWSEEVEPVFPVVPSGTPSLPAERIQMASCKKHGKVPKIICEGNKKKWISLLEEMEEHFCYTVEYSVNVEGSDGRIEARRFRVENHLMDIALQICVKWTGHSRVEEFLAKDSQSFHAVYLVACLFREFPLSRARRGNQDFHTEVSSSEIDCVIVQACPLSPRTRQCLLQEVMKMTEKVYNQKNIDITDRGMAESPGKTASNESGEEDDEDTENSNGDIGMLCTEAACDLFQ